MNIINHHRHRALLLFENNSLSTSMLFSTGAWLWWYYAGMREIYAHRRSVRHLILNMQASNEAESRPTSIAELKRKMRAQLQRDQPELTDAEIERRLERRVQHGMQPCAANLPCRIPPASALNTARAERKDMKRRIRSRRRSR